MHADTPEPPLRRKWHLQRWLVVLVAGMLAYVAWTEYAFRSALKQAEAMEWQVTYTDPVEEIRANWKKAFKKETWLDGVTDVNIWPGAELEQHTAIVHRLNPKILGIGNAQALHDLSAIKRLTRLEKLVIDDGHNLTNVDALTNLTALKWVGLNGCIALTNVDVLKGLKALENVVLFNCIGLTNVDGLKDLAVLKELDLTGCTGLTNVDALKGLTALEEVILIRCTGLTNVDGLKNLTALKQVWLDGCTKLTKEHITALKAALPTTEIDTENASPFPNIPPQ